LIELATYRRNVSSAPAFMPDHWEGCSDALNLREALDWRRSG